MDHQWRPMPAYGNICPVCSMSHFPFCPPPPPHSHPFPPFNQNPRFPPPPPPPEYPPPEPYFADGWQRNPNSNYSREDFAPPIFDYGNGYNVTNNGYVDRSYKRPRVEETGSGAYSGRGLADEERRLKLIRDHGGGGAGALGNAEMNGPRDGGSDLYSPFQPDGSNQPAAARDESYSQSVKYHNSQQDQYLHMGNPQDYRPPQPYGTPQYMRPPDYHSPAPFMDPRQVTEANRGSNMPRVGQYGVLNEERVFTGHLPPPPPPLPVSPPPPPPFEHPRSEFDAYSSPPKTSFSLFPVPFSAPESNPYLHNKPLSHVSTNLFPEKNSSLRQYLGEDRPFFSKQLSPEKPAAVDASCLFKQPHRATRPDHIVIILRGLPGSGKSYLAKMMRDLEVENGSNAPRIHSMDDYFMTEVEKVEEGDVSKSSGFIRGKKLTVKKVIEYCYEPEMEEAYRDSMLKAFKKTLEEGLFTFVIVDDRNLRVADFAQFWAIAKRSGYEVYVSEATYKDPVGCAARNVHGFTLDQIEKMAAQWEDVPPLYLKLDIKSLFHGDDLKESAIQEVDMDTEDGGFDNDPSTFQECKPEDANHHSVEDNAAYEDGEKRWDAEEVHPGGKVKELGKSKWSNDLDEDRVEGSENVKGDLHAVSGLMQAYKKRRKSVHWSDQGTNTGFSIGAAKKANILSLVIGPGAGYNLKSNPLHEEESKTLARNIGKSSGQSIFQEQLRAERESFKAVFDRRRQRIGGFDLDEE